MAKKKILTIQEIRQELIKEVGSLAEIRWTDYYERSDPTVVSHAVNGYLAKLVERAGQLYDESIEDKKRQLELGELADKFFQRIKLND